MSRSRVGGASSGCVAGVDGGGTRTRALLADLAGEPLGAGEGPPGIVDPARPSAASLAVGEAVRRAAEAAGVELPVRALWAGLAGAGREVERAAAENAVRALGLAGTVRVGTDGEAAFRDAFGDGAGILLVSGTGSMALGRDGGEREVRVGGWGALLGDEGSAYRIGLRGLRAVLRAHDGRGPVTVLRDRVLEEMGVAGEPDLVRAAADAPKARIAGLAGRVIEAAREGDPAAAEIVNRSVAELAEHVRAASARLGADPPLPVALAGGLLAPARPLRSRIEAALEATGHPVRTEEVRAVRGAAGLARELIGEA